MDFFSNLLLAFQITLEPMNIVFCFIGCLGHFRCLPGLGPAAHYLSVHRSRLPFPPELRNPMWLDYIRNDVRRVTTSIVEYPGNGFCCYVSRRLPGGTAGRAEKRWELQLSDRIAGTFGTVMIMLLAPPLSKFALKLARLNL